MSAPTAPKTAIVTVSKLDAARRQLSTAINLWFGSDDSVSIHTLACAAYEIIHTVSKKRNPGRRDLLFDSLVVKDEYRGDFAVLMKEPANFFKHAKNDVDAVIEFKPILTELFFMYSILGLRLCGEHLNKSESAFLAWIHIHKTHLLTDSGRKFLANTVPVDQIQHLKSLEKKEFFQILQLAWDRGQRRQGAK
jgi:hypothetical protein